MHMHYASIKAWEENIVVIPVYATQWVGSFHVTGSVNHRPESTLKWPFDGGV